MPRCAPRRFARGRIADRTRELLGPTDAGIVQFRRLVLERFGHPDD